MFLIGSVFTATGCEPEEAAGEEVDLVYVEWACAVATSHLLAEVIESELGYDVNLTSAEAGMAYSDIAAGGMDVFPAAWLPVTHQSYHEEYEGEFDDLGPLYEGARIGLTVPEYVDIDSIEEMDEIAEDLDHDIIGIEPGAGVMDATESAIETYDSLEDFNLVESSDAGMTAELETAIGNEEPIVVTGWTPHWKFAEWDLKFLEDPELVYGEEETINALTRLGFDEDAPEVYELLENFHITDDQLGEIMGMIEDTGDESGSAAEWAEENQDVVEDWLP
ncbi:glycine betaine ABC transporter substrate-binding protein [Natranaerofaba carboxydovora]|uniref:glycine betaine ABC transporter substrate-binding protein n=1 Tax=Natranaerofaba carboxydovora TaxID=2742683 RepID=UPI001F13B26A|nr:glycine betaine ABC transporter substrate-binding protein [Natranaerofaba carboxydovora]UMZ74626.1 Glycine betaine-binding protein OpuAC [Natranaerofaba carboxydovora]